MGCNATSAAQKVEPAQSKSAVAPPVSADPNPREEFLRLTSDIHSIKCPNGMVPIVCVSKAAFPLCIAPINLDGNETTEIKLPVAALSYSEYGKIICFAHISLFAPSYFESSNTAKFILNCIFWLNSFQVFDKPILLLNIKGKNAENMKISLEQHGFKLKMGDFNSTLSNYQIVFILSNDIFTKEYEHAILDFMANGGGVICFHVPDPDEEGIKESPINTFLTRFGFGYTYCQLMYKSTGRITVDVSNSIDSIKGCHMIDLCESFRNLLESDNIQTATLDDMIVTLRLHLMILKNYDQNELLCSLAKIAFDYLVKEHTNDEKDNEIICEDVNQSILLILLTDIVKKLSPRSLKPPPIVLNSFPGFINEFNPENVKMEILLHEESWISTGLWLSAGHTTIVKCNNVPPNLRIQVGMHNGNLLTKQGPYKRWPNVTSTFLLQEGTTEIGNCFDGIIYLIVSELDEEEDQVQKITLSFEGVTKYPRAVFNHSECYENTKKYVAPWAELITQTTIFTLPSKTLSEIKDIDKTCELIDIMVNKIITRMSYTLDRLFRIVFDIEIVPDNHADYPIYLLVSDIEDIFMKKMEPCRGTFKFLYSIALVSIRENCFPTYIESVIATLVVAIVMREDHHGFNVLNCHFIEKPPLFKELWIIHTQINPNLIPNMLAQSQGPDAVQSDSQEDLWVSFVRELCQQGNYNFSTMFEKINPIPLSLTAELSDLPALPSMYSCM